MKDEPVYELKVTQRDFQRSKPDDCTCGFPEIVVVTATGHHPTCPAHARIQREIDEAIRRSVREELEQDVATLESRPASERPRYVFFVFEKEYQPGAYGHHYEDTGDRGWELSAPWPWSLVPDESLGVCLYSPNGQIRLVAGDAIDAARAGQHGFRVERELPR